MPMWRFKLLFFTHRYEFADVLSDVNSWCKLCCSSGNCICESVSCYPLRQRPLGVWFWSQLVVVVVAAVGAAAAAVVAAAVAGNWCC